jgi:hypothetical protein
MLAAFERGAAPVRCEPKGEQPSTDWPPRSACELIDAEKHDELCMRAKSCIRPTNSVYLTPAQRRTKARWCMASDKPC